MNLISNRAEVAKIMENGGGRGAEEVERKLLLLSPSPPLNFVCSYISSRAKQADEAIDR